MQQVSMVWFWEKEHQSGTQYAKKSLNFFVNTHYRDSKQGPEFFVRFLFIEFTLFLKLLCHY